jgi:hypothetical protein
LKRTTATILGFFVAPMIPAFVGTAWGMALFGVHLESFLAFPLYYAGALAVTALLAVPLALLANYLGITRWWAAVAGGLLITILVDFIINWHGILASFSSDMLYHIIEWRMIMGSIGAVSGFVFWFIWRQGCRSSN